MKLTTPNGETVQPISPITTYTYQLAAVAAALDSGTPLASEGADTHAQQRALDAIYDKAGLGHLRHFGAAP